MTDEQYNGWRNHATWLVALWLDNERCSYNYWREQAADSWRDARTSNSSDGEVANTLCEAVGLLAKRLKEDLTDGSPLVDATMYADLLSSSLEQVDWHEVAENLITALCEYTNKEEST